METSFGIEYKELRCFTFFYESDGFYFSINVDLEQPFRAPGRMSGGSVIYSGDFGKSLMEWADVILLNRMKAKNLFEVQTKPGNYHPRMWRGDMENLKASMLAGSQAILSKAVVAGEIIIDRLFDLFTYIEPTKSNQNIFGHKVRELLLLSCMEVESGWTAILRANDYPVNNRLSTNDYVKLLDPLFLSRYEVQFSMYPEIGRVSPFKHWTRSQPTQSISWYNAYNNTKHNREDNFHASTLEHAISSVAAVAIMLYSQFGPASVPDGIEVIIENVDLNWPYIPLGTANRNVNPDGTTQGIGFNLTSTWTEEKFKF